MAEIRNSLGKSILSGKKLSSIRPEIRGYVRFLVGKKYVQSNGSGRSSGTGNYFGDGNGSGTAYGSGIKCTYDYVPEQFDVLAREFGDGDGTYFACGLKSFCGLRIYQIENIPTVITRVHGSWAEGLVILKDLSTVPCYIVKNNNKFYF